MRKQKNVSIHRVSIDDYVLLILTVPTYYTTGKHYNIILLQKININRY